MALLYHNKICISLYNLFKIIGKFNIDCLIFRPKTLLSPNLSFLKLIYSAKTPVFFGHITVAEQFFKNLFLHFKLIQYYLFSSFSTFARNSFNFTVSASASMPCTMQASSNDSP